MNYLERRGIKYELCREKGKSSMNYLERRGNLKYELSREKGKSSMNYELSREKGNQV